MSHGASRFVTREIEIPAELEGDSLPPSARSPSNQSGRSGGGSPMGSGAQSGATGAPPLPALPSSLLDALAREPPSNGSDGTAAPRSSLSYNRPPGSSSPQPPSLSTSTSPSLPTLPPHSPLGFSYSPSAPATLSERQRNNSNGSRGKASPLGDEGDGSGHNAGSQYRRGVERSGGAGESFVGQGEFASGSFPVALPTTAAALLHEKQPRRFMWKSFGRQRSAESSPSATPSPPTPNPTWGGGNSRSPPTHLATTSSPPISSTLATAKIGNTLAPAHPVVSRRPSSGRIRPSTGNSVNASKWLYEAQAATATANVKTRSGSAIGKTGLGLAEGTEEEGRGQSRRASRGGVSVRHAGRGVDAELDAMDLDVGAGNRLPGDEDDEDVDEEGEEGEEEEQASQWTGGREQYTHDLLRGAVSDSDVEETGTETEEEEEEEEEELTPEVDGESFVDAPETGEGDRTIMHPGPSNSGDSRRRPDLHLAEHFDIAQPDPSTLLPTSPSLVTPRASTSAASGATALELQGGGGSVPGSAPGSKRGSLTREQELAEGLRQLSMGNGTAVPPSPVRKFSSASRVSTADFIVAVVGPRNVGKSTVIRRGLKRPTGKPVVVAEDERENRVTTCTSHFTIGGQSRTIEVLEIDMALLKYNAEGVIWPEGLPQCEGAMLCYDSTDPRALDSLSLLLQAFWTRGSDIPLIVLACKAQPEAARNATDPNRAAAVCNIYGAGIVALDGGVEDPRKKMKESFNWVIRQIMSNRGEVRRPASSASSSPTESRRGSILPSDPHSSIPYTSAPPSSASALSSTGAPVFDNPFGELSLPAYAGASSSGGAESPSRSRGSRGGSLGLGLSIVQEAPVGSAEDEQQQQSTPLVREQTEGGRLEHAHPQAQAQTPHAGESGPLSALALLPESGGEEQQAQEGERKASNASTATRDKGTSTSGAGKTDLERKSSHGKSSALDLHFSREDMIDKFLFASVTGNDEQYVTLFLIVYRRFARPFDVLTKLIERFDFVHARIKTDPLLSRFAQMKLCGVLSTWLQVYPGDFTSPATFGLLQPFLMGLLPRGATWVAHYAIELIPLLSALPQMSDPEASWALPDRPIDGASAVTPPSTARLPPERRPSLAPSYDSTASSMAPDSFDGSSSRLSVPASTTTNSSQGTDAATTPPTTVVHSPQEGRHRTSSDAGTIDTVDSNDPARSFNSSSNGSSWKKGIPAASTLLDLSNALMELPEDVVAVQITRIAWEAFADMTPRDLMRHVLAPRDPKNPRTALRDAKSNVMQSINFVNYLAEWVATLILVQSKLKWRARILEKFITIAYSLREQENFDSLMGILAGLNSQPVFRLSETMETINLKLEGDRSKMPKRLRSLNKLMATTKSFSAYRLALANSGANMLPYLGVHLQDITVVNEIKSDMRDGKVNWSKFSQMGRSAAIVLDCSRLAPSLPIDRAVERCILNVPLLDKDKQYSLSYSYQPRASSVKPVSSTRRRLKNLADKSPFF